MQTCLGYDMVSNSCWQRFGFANTTSQMCSSLQTWKSLASANDCRGWCTCFQPAKLKKGVALGRCVSPTCANADLHHPTYFQKWLQFLLEGRIVNRGLHLRITPMHVKLQCQKCVLTEGRCLCGCHHLWHWAGCPYGCLSLHIWKLGVMQVPIGKEREVWKLKYQVFQNYTIPSKRNFQKGHSLPLWIMSKGKLETKNMGTWHMSNTLTGDLS